MGGRTGKKREKERDGGRSDREVRMEGGRKGRREGGEVGSR